MCFSKICTIRRLFSNDTVSLILSVTGVEIFCLEGSSLNMRIEQPIQRILDCMHFAPPRATRSRTRSSHEALQEDTKEVLFSYPTKEDFDKDPNLKGGSVTITLSDLERLVPDEFMNDSLVDFYLR